MDYGKIALGLFGLGIIIGYWYALFWFVTNFIMGAHLTVGGIFLGILGILGLILGFYITFFIIVFVLALTIFD